MSAGARVSAGDITPGAAHDRFGPLDGLVGNAGEPEPVTRVARGRGHLVTRDVLPRRLREAMTRAMVPDQVAATGPAARADYHHRMPGPDNVKDD